LLHSNGINNCYEFSKLSDSFISSIAQGSKDHYEQLSALRSAINGKMAKLNKDLKLEQSSHKESTTSNNFKSTFSFDKKRLNNSGKE
jgi:Skp family chaperone for outer membrane proteins